MNDISSSQKMAGNWLKNARMPTSDNLLQMHNFASFLEHCQVKRLEADQSPPPSPPSQTAVVGPDNNGDGWSDLYRKQVEALRNGAASLIRNGVDRQLPDADGAPVLVDDEGSTELEPTEKKSDPTSRKRKLLKKRSQASANAAKTTLKQLVEEMTETSEAIPSRKRKGRGKRPGSATKDSTVAKVFSCSLCQKTFARKDSLPIHMRSHTGEKPYKCELCNKRFFSASGRTFHMRSHTGETPFHCPVCSRGFVRPDGLNQHMSVHTGERPHLCKICRKEFRLLTSLRRHLKIHKKKAKTSKVNLEAAPKAKEDFAETNSEQHNGLPVDEDLEAERHNIREYKALPEESEELLDRDEDEKHDPALDRTSEATTSMVKDLITDSENVIKSERGKSPQARVFRSNSPNQTVEMNIEAFTKFMREKSPSPADKSWAHHVIDQATLIDIPKLEYLNANEDSTEGGDCIKPQGFQPIEGQIDVIFEYVDESENPDEVIDIEEELGSDDVPVLQFEVKEEALGDLEDDFFTPGVEEDEYDQIPHIVSVQSAEPVSPCKDPPKRRGRPKKAEKNIGDDADLPAPTPKKCGQKSKSSSPAKADDTTPQAPKKREPVTADEAAPPTPKKRGRKSKSASLPANADEAAPAAPKKRGRKSKSSSPANADNTTPKAPKKLGRTAKSSSPAKADDTTPQAPKKRGRKPKSSSPANDDEAALPHKKRGRKPKSSSPANDDEAAPAATKKRGRKLKSSSPANADDATPQAPKKRGRKPNPNGAKELKCTICDKILRHKESLRTHMLAHKGAKPHQCTVCEKSYCGSSGLAVHMRTHTGELPFKCPACPKAFIRAAGLAEHWTVHTGNKPFECEICHKKFRLLVSLKRHATTHNGEKPFKCKDCGKGFGRASNLRSHSRTHTKERPYPCPLCHLRFSQSQSLHIHCQRLHKDQMPKGGPPYECDICEKRFAHGSGLLAHKNTHEEKPKCEVCSEAFDSLDLLFEHMMKSHSETTPFQCELCDAKFKRPSGIQKHYVKMHPGLA